MQSLRAASGPNEPDGPDERWDEIHEGQGGTCDGRRDDRDEMRWAES